MWTTTPGRGCGRRSRCAWGWWASASPAAALLAHDPTLRVTAIDPARYAAGAGRCLGVRSLAADRASRAARADHRSAGVVVARAARHGGTAADVAPGDAASDSGRRRCGARTSRLRAPIERPTLQTIVASEREHAAGQHRGGRAGPLSWCRVLGAGCQLRRRPPAIRFSSATRWTGSGRPERGLHHQPGRSRLPPSTRRLVSPSGRALPLITLDDHVSATLPDPGLYLADTAGGQRVLSVGLDDPGAFESDGRARCPRTDSAPLRSGGAAQPWWIYCAAGRLRARRARVGDVAPAGHRLR